MTRGESRGFAIFGAIVMALVLVAVPIITGYDLREKISSFALFALFILLIKDIMNGKVWDYAHRGDKNEKTKDS